MRQSEIRGITRFPEYVFRSTLQEGEEKYPDENRDRNQLTNRKKILIVTAVQKEYEALIDVLRERNYECVERSSSAIGGRDLRYSAIKGLKL